MSQRRDDVSVIRLVIPMGIGALSQIILGFADTAIVGHLQTGLPLAAVGAAWAIYAVAAQVVFASTIGYQIMAARAIGSGDRERVAQLFLHGFLFSGGLALLLGAGVIVGADHLAGLLLGPGAVRAEAAGWLRLRAPGMLFLSAAGMLRATLDADGRPIFGMAVALTQNVLNAVATMFLVFGWWGFPRLEVPGSALGSSISDLYALLVLIVIHARVRVIPFGAIRGWSLALLADLTRLGAPEMVNMAFDYIGNLLFVAIVAGLGPIAIAGSRLAFTVMLILFALAMVGGVAVQITVARALGAGAQVEVAMHRLREGVLLGLACFTFVGVVIFLGAPQVARFFAASPETVTAAIPTLRVIAITAPLMAVTACYVGALRALRRTKTVMQVNLASVYLVELPLAFVFSRLLEDGLTGAYLGFVGYFIARTLFNIIALRRAQRVEAQTVVASAPTTVG